MRSLSEWAADRREKFSLLILPRPSRFPRRSADWIPFVIVVVLLAGSPFVIWKAGSVTSRIGCRSGLLPSSQVWSQGGECVGLSEAPYAFGHTAFDGVFKKIAEQNKAARDGSCAGKASAVTIGVLMTMSSPELGGRAVHQLEGITAGQAMANRPGCIHPVRLLVGQMGATEQASVRVARAMAGRSGVVGVVGLGLSAQRSADAIRELAARRIPMVSDLITAEGFDKNGSADDRPGFDTCQANVTYKAGVGQGFFYRVAFRGAVQIDQLAKYVQREHQKIDFILTPITVDDPYTCTTLPLLHRKFGDVPEVRFDPGDPATVAQSAKRICSTNGPVGVFYSARGSDLTRFLTSVERETQNGLCQASGVTVVSASDVERIRALEIDSKLDQQRTEALTSPTFKDGSVRLLYTPLADPDVLTKAGSPGYARLEKLFTDEGFDTTDLDDGWAINGYGAAVTVATAVNTLSGTGKVTPGQVNTVISGFSTQTQAVPAGDGNITFDNNGNRSDSVPVVVRLCPPASGSAGALHPATVEVYPKRGRCP